MTTVINKHKTKKYDVYIGRGSIWGNPFIIGRDGNREDVIRKYAEWIQTQPQLLSNLHLLKDKTLACFCSPKHCHGDILAELVNKL